MGEADEVWASRVPLLTPYRVTAEVMAATHRPDTRFMHCLPAVHDTTTELGARVQRQFGLDGAEVTDEELSGLKGEAMPGDFGSETVEMTLG